MKQLINFDITGPFGSSIDFVTKRLPICVGSDPVTDFVQILDSVALLLTLTTRFQSNVILRFELALRSCRGNVGNLALSPAMGTSRSHLASPRSATRERYAHSGHCNNPILFHLHL